MINIENFSLYFSDKKLEEIYLRIFFIRKYFPLQNSDDAKRLRFVRAKNSAISIHTKVFNVAHQYNIYTRKLYKEQKGTKKFCSKFTENFIKRVVISEEELKSKKIFLILPMKCH